MTCYKFNSSHWLKLQRPDWRANLVKVFPPMRELEFITGHMIYNLAYTEILQMTTTKINMTDLICLVSKYLHLRSTTVCRKAKETLLKTWITFDKTPIYLHLTFFNSWTLIASEKNRIIRSKKIKARNHTQHFLLPHPRQKSNICRRKLIKIWNFTRSWIKKSTFRWYD